MLNLDKLLVLDAEALKSANLAERFDSDDLARIGEWVHEGYARDRASRAKWERRMEAAMDLAMQIQKDKSFPWPGCSNVAFPLVTIATMQFHARAYPAMITGKDIVKCRVLGKDPDGKKKERAARVSAHMSYQVLEEDEPWEEGQDSLLINYAVVGTAFKKSYYAGDKSHNVSELVMARDLVLDYWAKSVEDCPRKTHLVPFFRNEIYERVKRGTFCDVLEEAWYKAPAVPHSSTTQVKTDNRAGVSPPTADETTPFTCLEQHCSLDLDGDGYAEPYIITIEESSHAVLRIVTRFDRPEEIERVSKAAFGTPAWWKEEVVRITPTEYFTRYLFLPSPDGGVYGVGFGILLGPINESVNSAINQLFDAGTMLTSAGGFLARGAKIRGGVYTFAPLEWKRVDSTGDDLRKSIVPLELRQPSPVLFQVLSLLIQYADRIPGTNEMSVGENPGQNTPAYTSQEMVRQGMKIYAAIFKRGWRSMKEEFKKLFKLNAVYLSTEQEYGAEGGLALREDYLGDARAVIPAADPNITSEEMQIAQANALVQAAYTRPGYDYSEAEKRWLRAMKIEGAEQVYPGPGQVKLPPLPNPKVQVETIKQQAKQAQLQLDKMMFAANLMEQHKLNEAKIVELHAKATLELKEAGGVDAGHRIAAFEAAIGALKTHNESLFKQAELILKSMESEDGGADKPGGGPVQGMAPSPDNAGAEALGGIAA